MPALEKVTTSDLEALVPLVAKVGGMAPAGLEVVDQV